ncbi:hypothetical protein TNCV_330021 [Trichonephila clavipes]|nr:hypothetical protein TNCV_330021 [Trichonephila clavipes]
MHTCTRKYCGVLSSDIALATYDREKTNGWTPACRKPRSVIRGVGKKHPSQDHGLGRGFRGKTPKRTVVLSPTSELTYSEL